MPLEYHQYLRTVGRASEVTVTEVMAHRHLRTNPCVIKNQLLTPLKG